MKKEQIIKSNILTRFKNLMKNNSIMLTPIFDTYKDVQFYSIFKKDDKGKVTESPVQPVLFLYMNN